MFTLFLSFHNTGLTVAQLERDYFTVAREKVPYIQFGHPDLLDFVKSVPDMVQVFWCHKRLFCL